MDTNTEVFDLAQAATAHRARVGGKAGVLGELAAAGFPVPPGLVVTAGALNHDGWERSLEAAARSLGAPRLAVRSSAAAEDLPDASYAGLYETYLNVPADGLGEAVRRCFAAATAERVSAYHQRHGDGTAPDGCPGTGDGGPDGGRGGLHRPSRQRRPRSGLSHRGARPG